MALMTVQALSERELRDIHDASLTILRDTGVMVHHERMLARLAEAGARVDRATAVARLPEARLADLPDLGRGTQGAGRADVRPRAARRRRAG